MPSEVVEKSLSSERRVRISENPQKGEVRRIPIPRTPVNKGKKRREKAED
jgi:hypothetical protein